MIGTLSAIAPPTTKGQDHMSQIIEPIPGDVRTEPVATAEQAAGETPGRVGPPTIAQDAATQGRYSPEGVELIQPGEVVSAETPRVSAAFDTTGELDDVDGDGLPRDPSQPQDTVHVENDRAPAGTRGGEQSKAKAATSK